MIKLIKIGCISPTLSEVYSEQYSLIEKMAYIAKTLNETIIQVNKNTSDIESINVDEINRRIDNINEDMRILREDFNTFKIDINNDIEARFIEVYNRVVSLMNDYQNIFNLEIERTKNELNERIDQIELGDIKAYDPTTGEISNISIVIQNVYDSLRANAITVSEFEALDLTATEFDAYEITASNFDLNSKDILV